MNMNIFISQYHWWISITILPCNGLILYKNSITMVKTIAMPIHLCYITMVKGPKSQGVEIQAKTKSHNYLVYGYRYKNWLSTISIPTWWQCSYNVREHYTLHVHIIIFWVLLLLYYDFQRKNYGGYTYQKKTQNIFCMNNNI